MTGLTVSVDYFPIVWITVGEDASDRDYHALFEKLQQVMERGRRFVSLAEASGMNFPSTSQRKIINDWYPMLKARAHELSLGNAMVLKTPLQRGAVTAISWVMRPQIPMGAFETRGEALAWSRDRLVERGQPISPALARLLGEEGVGVTS